MDLLERVKILCEIPGVSGREHAVTNAIEEMARPFADEMRRDAMGNLLIFKRGAKQPAQPVMLAAHMDEVGFMVCHITESGLLKLVAVGGLYPQTLSGRTLWFPRSDIYGVLGRAPVHLRKERDALPELDDLYVDIGALDKEDAQKHIKLGDMAVFDTETRAFGDDGTMGKALDDRLGCALLLELIERPLPVDCWFAFTVQEELGLRGAATAAFAIRPGYAIVVDVGGGADNAGFSGADTIAKSGAGPIVSFADAATAYDFELFEAVTALADQNRIPWQTKTRISGGTDAGAIHRAAEGCRVVGISVSGRNIHSAVSSVCLSDARHALALIEKTLEHFSHVG